MMKNIISFAFASIFSVILASTAALALEEEVKQACEPDIAAYCAAVSDDDEALKSCLEENKDVVSAQCRQAMDEAEQS